MNFRKLEIFYETALCLNMTKVAKKMYISQPSISQSIQELEEEVGVKLFDRLGKRLYLTNEGNLFLNYTRRILNLYEESINTLDEYKHNDKGRITIGASTTIGIYILPDIIKAFSEKYPDIEISIIIENTNNIKKLILENKVDFAYVEGEIKSEEINKEKVWEDELVFICGNNHKWNKVDTVKSEDLSGEKLIMREYGSGSREIIEDYLKINKIDYNIFLEFGNTEAIKRTVAANLGIGCISEKCIEENISQGNLNSFRLEERKIKRDLLLIMHKDKFISNNMKEFICFSKENYKD